jgi:hypothetical protein
MQIFHQHKLLINEQNSSDINPLYELAVTSRIPLQKKRTLTPSMNSQTRNEYRYKKRTLTQSHSVQHTPHTPLSRNAATAHNL